MRQRFPADAPRRRVIRAFEMLGFTIVRERQHIIMVRNNVGGTRNTLTMPNHSRIKGATLRSICTQSRISRSEFMAAYSEV